MFIKLLKNERSHVAEVNVKKNVSYTERWKCKLLQIRGVINVAILSS